MEATQAYNNLKLENCVERTKRCRQSTYQHKESPPPSSRPPSSAAPSLWCPAAAPGSPAQAAESRRAGATRQPTKSWMRGGGSVYLRGGAVGPHAAGVGAEVSVLQPLVVLRRRHRRHWGAVAETQTLQDEGRVNLLATQTQSKVKDFTWSLTDTSSPSRSSSTTTVSPADPKARSCSAQMRELTIGRISRRHQTAMKLHEAINYFACPTGSLLCCVGCIRACAVVLNIEYFQTTANMKSKDSVKGRQLSYRRARLVLRKINQTWD